MGNTIDIDLSLPEDELIKFIENNKDKINWKQNYDNSNNILLCSIIRKYQEASIHIITPNPKLIWNKWASYLCYF